MNKIANSIYISTDYPGVTVGAIITDDGVICVDAPIRPDDVQDWQDQIASVTDAPIRYVVNTDAQRERVIGQQWLGATVVATEAAGEKMRAYNDSFRQQVADMMVQLDALEAVEEVLLNFKVLQPQITFRRVPKLPACGGEYGRRDRLRERHGVHGLFLRQPVAVWGTYIPARGCHERTAWQGPGQQSLPALRAHDL